MCTKSTDIIEELLIHNVKIFSGVHKIKISRGLVNSLNPEIVTVDNVWALLCLTSAINKQDVKTDTYLYKCDVDSIHPNKYGGQEVLDAVLKLLVKVV